MKYTRMLMYCRKGRAAASVPDLKDYGFGENGTQAWNKVQENEAVRNNRRLRAGFTAMYQAGIRGESASAVKSDAAKYIPPSVQTAAYQAGLADAAESLAREKAAVQFVSSAGSESGLVDNEYSRKLAEEKSGTAALLSMLGKDLGVRVEIVPKVLGGNANGQYVASRNLVQIAADADNAFEFVAAHEVTHRMQSLAPEEYRSYRDYAIRFRAQELGEEGAAALVERYQAMSEEAGVALTQEEAMDEIAADLTMRMIEDGGLFEDFAKENRSEAKKLLDALKAFVQKVKSLFRGKEARDKAAREAYGKDMSTLEECAARWQKAYEAAGNAAKNAKTAAGEGSGVKYSLKNTNDKNIISIKQQIANAEEMLNSMEPVARKDVSALRSGMSIKQKRAWAEAEALKYGNRVDRKAYGEIEVSRKDVNSALNYLKSDGEIAAFSALPSVLKRGQEIYREADHKGRGYSTVTFAAPVVINGTRGNMAVVVRETSKNHYDMHRIVMPDGSAFMFSEKTNAEPGPTAATSKNDALTQPTASASKNSIPISSENVKGKFSLKGMDSAYLAAVERGDTEAAQNAKTAAGEGSGNGRLMLKGLSYDGKTLYADSEVYNYDFLVSQPDMVVYELPPLSEVKVEGEISRDAATSLGLKNAAEIGEKRQDGTYVIVNRYTGRQIVLGKGGLNHSLNAENSGEKSSINRLRTNSRLSAIGGYVVQNAIPINGLKNKNRQANGTYAMACLTNSGNRSVVAIVTVEEHSSRVASIDYVDVTHSISGRLRKNESSRSSTREKGYGLSAAPTTTAYNISIADFLDIVNETYRSILSDDVLRHYGEERPADGYYSNRVLFQLKSVTELEQEVKELKKYAAYRKRGTSDREILASTADGSAQTEWERKRLSEYKDVVSRLETYERRLAENKAKLAKD